MILLPPVALTGARQAVLVDVHDTVFDRLLCTNSSPWILDVYSGGTTIKLQPYEADILKLQSINLILIPTGGTTTLQVASPQLQLEAIGVEEQITGTYPQQVTPPAVSARGTVLTSGLVPVGDTNFDIPTFPGVKGIYAVMKVPVGQGTDTVRMRVFAVSVSGIVSPTAVADTGPRSAGTYPLRVYPGIPAVANEAVPDVLDASPRIVLTATGHTYGSISVDYDLLT
jgi:hypothetical protein